MLIAICQYPSFLPLVILYCDVVILSGFSLNVFDIILTLRSSKLRELVFSLWDNFSAFYQDFLYLVDQISQLDWQFASDFSNDF